MLVKEAELSKNARNKTVPYSEGAEIATLIKTIATMKKTWMPLYERYTDGKLSREDFLVEKKKYDEDTAKLLGAPRKLICQCCGMPLDDCSISKEPNGTINEEYCKWCYADGTFVYASLEELTDFLVGHMSNENWPPEQARAYFEEQLAKLNHWQQSKG